MRIGNYNKRFIFVLMNNFFLKEKPGRGLGAFDQVFGGAFKNDFSSKVATFGTQINYPVAAFNNFGIMFNDNQRMSFV